jgi:hypothetical protein
MSSDGTTVPSFFTPPQTEEENVMASAKNRIPVPGSERAALPGARLVGAADPNERLLVTVLVRRRSPSTSAVAPLWAGLIALLNEKLDRAVGYLNPVLYSLPHSVGAFRDITTGDNGAYPAQPGWDACTGWGSPDGAKLLSTLSEQ